MSPHCRLRLIVLSMLLGLSATGCSSLKLPIFRPPTSDSPYVPVGEGVVLAGHESQDMYFRVRQARNENAVVLEIVGDDEPLRVLPLPPDQKTVYVSTLLKQTGVINKFGGVEAVLYRHSSDSVAGIRMNVKTNKDGDQIAPESDYALKAGDRLQVREKENNAVTAFMSSVLKI